MRWSACFLLPALVACGAERLPPPASPPRVLSAPVAVPDAPPAAGTGRVVLESEGTKADVLDEDARIVCTTPCVAELAYGTHPLIFVSTADRSRTSEVDVRVGPEPKVVRHRMGERYEGGALRSLGFAVLVLGAVTAVGGAAAWATDATDHAPLITGVGAGLAGLAVPALFLDRPTQRPGSTTEWAN